MTMRAGIIAKKVGMSNLYTSNGVNIPITVLHVDECRVIERTELENSENDKVLLGACGLKKTKKSIKGFFDKKNIKPFNLIKEFFIAKSEETSSGDELTVEHFQEGQFIDVSGITKGKGFAGVMKRHNFSGLKASHGVSAAHRHSGATGQCQDPGKVFKGKKMAGQYGDQKKTLQSLQVVKIDPIKKIICVKGATPGARGAWLVIEDSIKQKEIKDIDLVIPSTQQKSDKKSPKKEEKE